MEHKNKPRGNPIIKHIEDQCDNHLEQGGDSDLNLICIAACNMEKKLPSSAELSVGLRHVLDAVTAFKRAFKEPQGSISQGDVEGDGKCTCKVSFYGEYKNPNLIKITDIVGIETYCDPAPSEIELPLPLPRHYKLAWHNISGFAVLEILGAPAPTFIPCLGGGQLDNICAHLGRPVPANGKKK